MNLCPKILLDLRSSTSKNYETIKKEMESIRMFVKIIHRNPKQMIVVLVGKLKKPTKLNKTCENLI